MANQTTISENKMGVQPIPKLLISMSLPMILSMLVQAMYNVVDSVFVAQINENALTAVSLAFPIQNLMISVASGTAVGINALLSRSLGEGNRKMADSAAKNGIFLGVLSYLVFALFGIAGSHFFFLSQTKDAEIVRFGTDYLSVVCICSFGMFLQMTYERLLQSTGRTFYTMITQGTGAIINIILDPILIFGLFGMPRLGVSGAAIATVAGQIVAMLLAILFNKKKNPDIDTHMKGFRPKAATIRNIYQVGVPSIIMMSIGSVMTFGMNKILLMFSSTAAAVFGVYFKLQSFIFMPVFGLNNGMVPIVAFNYGAQNKKRIMDTVWLSIVISVSIMIIGILLFQLCPSVLLGFFNASDDLLAIGVPALKTISWSFTFAGFCIIVGSVFQALGNGVYSLWVSIARQLLAILPIAYFFAVTWGLDAVWWSFPLAEIVSVILSSFLFHRIYKKKIKNLGR